MNGNESIRVKDVEIQYRRNAKNNYVVLKESELVLKDYKLNMILKNDIPGILMANVSSVNGQTELSYIISSKESIKDLYEKNKMVFEDIFNILKAIIRVYDTVQDYLLKAEDILLEPELIYYDYSTKEYSFCYYPNTKRDLTYEIRNLIEKLMIITEHKDRKGVELIYGVFSICNKKEFMIQDIEDYMKKYEENCFSNHEEFERAINSFTEKQGYWNGFHDENKLGSEKDDSYDVGLRYDELSEKVQYTEQSYNNVVCENSDHTYLNDLYLQDMKNIVKNNTIIKKLTDVLSLKIKKNTTNEKKNSLKKEYFEIEKNKLEEKNNIIKATTVKEKDNREYENDNDEEVNDNTMFINHTIDKKNKILYSLDHQNNIEINTNPFIIGKLSSRVDFVIEDNTVSRIHLKIVNENGEYYFEDMNSKNGTFLNGIQAQPHEKVKIQTGDKIRIAGYEYIFQ